MKLNKVFQHARQQLKQGASEAGVRELLMGFGLSLYEADQFLLREKTKRSFVSVRWLSMLFACYLWVGLIYFGLHVASIHAELTTQKKVVNLATLAVALFVVGLLFRPKPQGFKVRTLYSLIELIFPAALITLAIVLTQHSGWVAPSLPDGGAFASTVWPLLWLGAWLGPQILAVFALFLGHYALLKIRTSYFINRQVLLLEQRKDALRNHYQAALAEAQFIPDTHITNLAQKLVKLLLSNNEWNPRSTIDIYAIGQHIHVKPLGGGSAIITASTLSPETSVKPSLPSEKVLTIEGLELANYLPKP